jgi:hypothetical protein
MTGSLREDRAMIQTKLDRILKRRHSFRPVICRVHHLEGVNDSDPGGETDGWEDC